MNVAELPFTQAVASPSSFVQFASERFQSDDAEPVHVSVSADRPPAHASATARAAPSLRIPLRALVVFMSM